MLIARRRVKGRRWTGNARAKSNGKPKPNPLRADPTRMYLIRRKFDAMVKQRFKAVLADLRKLIVEDDSFGIKEPRTFNAFCPTGKGGGVDPTCSKSRPQRDDLKGRGTYRIFYRASYDKPDSKLRSIVVKSPSAYLALKGFKKRYGSVTSVEMKVVNSAGPVDNSFCPTGPGGGIDPTCSPGSGASSSTPDPKIEAWATAKFGSAAKGKAFAKWFAGSKVVDEKGEPLVVYHGTRADFQEFDIGRSSRHQIQGAYFSRAADSGWSRDVVYPVYLAIKNPASSQDVVQALNDTGFKGKEATELLKSRGFDGADRGYEIIAFHSTQIKSSIGNRGTFDPADPSIINVGNLTANAPYRFRFATSTEQIAAFQQWLSQRIYYHVLGTSLEQVERAWWTQYVEEGYRKGAGRAFDDVKKPLHKPDTWSERLPWYDGTRREFLESSFGRAVRVEKVKLLAGRVFTELKGVTEEMSTRLSRDLTDGLVQGKRSWDIYKKMAEDVGISERRAMLIARTELTRVHAEGQLDAMEEMGVEQVNVMVEWSTAGDLRVCRMCAPMEGVVFKIQEARGLLPRHPSCRCGFLPTNVGESKAATKVGWQKTPIKQTRTQKGVEGAIKESLKAEGKGQKTTWPGVDVKISKARPEPFVGNDGTENRSFFADCQRDSKGRCRPGGSLSSGFASGKEQEISLAVALNKIKNVPIPSRADVVKARRELRLAAKGEARAGGESRGGSAKDRRIQRHNLFKEFGGSEKGYVVCPWTGLKMHWTDDPGQNPKGYPRFERGKIFLKCQGGGYKLSNLIPESFAANRARNDVPARKENLSGCRKS